MRDPTREEQKYRSLRHVIRAISSIAIKVTDMIQGHNNHNQTSHYVDGFDTIVALGVVD